MSNEFDVTKITTRNELDAYKTANTNSKSVSHLESVFSNMDTNADGIIQEEEGAIFCFSDGTVSGMKYEKQDDGSYANGHMMYGIMDDGLLIEKEGNNTKTTRKMDDGSNLVIVYNENNVLLSKKLITSDGKEYALSASNNKVALLEKDGSLKTKFTDGDSFEGTMIRLGLDTSDDEVRRAFEEANPEAAKRGYFTVDENNNDVMTVNISKAILEKYDVKFFDNSVSLKTKFEKTTPRLTPQQKKLNSIVSDYYKYVDGLEEKDSFKRFEKKLEKMDEFTIKYQKFFREILGKPDYNSTTGAFKTLKTNKYQIMFRAHDDNTQTNPKLGSNYWQLFSISEIEQK